MHMHTNKAVLDVGSSICVCVLKRDSETERERERERERENWRMSVLNRSNPSGITSSVRSLPFR